MVEVGVIDDRGPCGACIFDDGSCYGFVGMNECFLVLAHDVLESTLYILIVLYAFVLVYFMC